MSESGSQDVDTSHRQAATIEGRDSPDADPLGAGLTLAAGTTTEWLATARTAHTTAPGWPALALKSLPPGTTAKFIYQDDDIRADPLLIADARQLSASGALVTVTRDWLPDMAISDRQAAVIFAGPAEAVCIYQAETVSILTVLFDQTWAAATPLELRLAKNPASDCRQLLEAERKLLNLLAAGATDETAARQLGISLRTARRHMATLMSHLAATSRFQAGAEAVKRGWLT
jgi:DNA-binding CsgD family transcriptional regulator